METRAHDGFPFGGFKSLRHGLVFAVHAALCVFLRVFLRVASGCVLAGHAFLKRVARKIARPLPIEYSHYQFITLIFLCVPLTSHAQELPDPLSQFPSNALGDLEPGVIDLREDEWEKKRRGSSSGGEIPAPPVIHSPGIDAETPRKTGLGSPERAIKDDGLRSTENGDLRIRTETERENIFQIKPPADDRKLMDKVGAPNAGAQGDDEPVTPGAVPTGDKGLQRRLRDDSLKREDMRLRKIKEDEKRFEISDEAGVPKDFPRAGGENVFPLGLDGGPDGVFRGPGEDAISRLGEPDFDSGIEIPLLDLAGPDDSLLGIRSPLARRPYRLIAETTFGGGSSETEVWTSFIGLRIYDWVIGTGYDRARWLDTKTNTGKFLENIYADVCASLTMNSTFMSIQPCVRFGRGEGVFKDRDLTGQVVTHGKQGVSRKYYGRFLMILPLGKSRIAIEGTSGWSEDPFIYGAYAEVWIKTPLAGLSIGGESYKGQRNMIGLGFSYGFIEIND